MAVPIAKNASITGIAAEVTQGTYVAPASATDYLQTLEGIENNPVKEVVERNVLQSSIGKVPPRAGLESVSGSLPVEFKGSGTEGAAPEYWVPFKSALGAERTLAARITTKLAGNTASVLQIEDADIASLNLYDSFVVLEAGAHHPCFITAKTSGVGTATVTVSPAKPSGVFSGNVQISKFKTYYTANTGHPAYSVSTYWANEITQKALGCRTTQLNLANFATGQIASWEMSFEGLSFDRINGVAPHTPSFPSVLPPIIVSQACVYQNGVALNVNQVDISLQNEVSFVDEICDGRTASRVVGRSISGSMNPYMDDTDVTQFTKFDLQSLYTLFLWAGNPSGVAGELELGSVIAVCLPNVNTTEMPTGDLDGLLLDEISFAASRGAAGSVEEMFVSFV